MSVHTELIDEHVKHIFETRPEPMPTHREVHVLQLRNFIGLDSALGTRCTGSRSCHQVRESIAVRVHMHVRGRHSSRIAFVFVAEDRLPAGSREDLDRGLLYRHVLLGSIESALERNLEKQMRFTLHIERYSLIRLLTNGEAGTASHSARSEGF